MRLVLHPKVSSDISKIMEFYEQVATAELADEFYRELRHFIHEAAERPESFAMRERDIAEVHGWTDFAGRFVHLRTGAVPEDPVALMTAVLADATNLGLEASRRRSADGATVPALIEAVMRRVSSQFSSILERLMTPPIRESRAPWSAWPSAT